MKKRYAFLGFTSLLALAIAMPAVGFSTNPIAETAVTLSKVNKKAKAAKRAAAAAQASADQANGLAQTANTNAINAQNSADAAQATADGAQATADQALAEAAEVSFADLGADIEFDSSPSDSTSPKTVNLTCSAGQTPISASGTPWAQALVADNDIEYGGMSWYLGPRAIAIEENAIATNWTLDVSGVCVRASG